MALWEQILIGAFAIGIIIFMFPRLKVMFEESAAAPKDWPGFLLPIALVVGFVFLLIALV